MPFDGSEFSQAPQPPRRPVQATAGSRAPLLAAWLRRLRPGRIGPKAGGDEASAVQLLRAARLLIGDEERWVRGAYETPAGKRCAVGALRAAARGGGGGRRGSLSSRQAHALLLAVSRRRGFDDVEAMNDHSSHAQVLAAFGAAIAVAAAR
jgi:hypothetical protein